MKQEIMHVDATPTPDYPVRILKAYRERGDIWSDTSGKTVKVNPFIAQMNEWQRQRNELLDKAIAILEKAAKKEARRKVLEVDYKTRGL